MWRALELVEVCFNISGLICLVMGLLALKLRTPAIEMLTQQVELKYFKETGYV